MVSETTRIYCKLDMTSSFFLRKEAHHTILYDGFRKRDHDFLLAFHSNVLSGMHGFQDNEVLLPTLYEVIVISPPGSASDDFSWRSLKERPWLPDSIYGNFLTGIHGFRDNEVLLPTGNDVIVIHPLGGVSHRFCWRNLKEQPQFHNHGSLTYYLLPFLSYSTFYVGW